MIALEVCRSSVTRSRRQFFQFGEEKALTPQIKRPEFGRPQETPHVVSGGLPVDLRNRAAQRFVQPGHVDGDLIISRPGTGLDEIGRASCRERGCQYVWISVVAGSLKKNTK